MPVGLFGEHRNTTSGWYTRTCAIACSGVSSNLALRWPSSHLVAVTSASKGCMEYDGENPMAVRPGPPKACRSCCWTSLEPLPAHMFADGQAIAQVSREILPQRSRVPVRVAVEVAQSSLHRLLDGIDHQIGQRVRVLVGVEPHRHVELRCAVGVLPAQVIADGELFEQIHAPKPRRDRLPVRGQVLHVGERDHVRRDLPQRGLVVADDVDPTQEGLDRQSATVPRTASGRQHVVGAGAVVAERHRRVRPDEDRAGVAHPQCQLVASAGLDLQVFGRVGVDDHQAGVEVVDEHRAGLLTGQGCGDAAGVLGHGHEPGQFRIDGTGQRLAGRDEDARGGHVVLGLTDQVGGDMVRVGGVVGQDRDLGRASLGVDADRAADKPLRRGHVDVAGSGDEVDGVADAGAVREHGDRLSTADGVHLVHAEQRAGGEHAGVGPAGLFLRRAGDGDRADAGDLGRHHVHDHAGRIHREAAGDIQPDPGHRHPTLGD